MRYSKTLLVVVLIGIISFYCYFEFIFDSLNLNSIQTYLYLMEFIENNTDILNYTGSESDYSQDPIIGNASPINQIAVQPSLSEYGNDVLQIIEIEAEQYHNNINIGDHRWILKDEEQASNKQALLATPNIGVNNNNNYLTRSPRLDYIINFEESGNYYAWVFGRATGESPGKNDSIHLGLDGQKVESGERISGFSTAFSWSNKTMDKTKVMIEILDPGTHTLNLWMREDGFIVDKVVLTTDANFDPRFRKLANSESFEHSSFKQSANGDKFIQVEAEQYYLQTSANNQWNFVNDNQASENQALQTEDLGMTNNEEYQDSSPRLDYLIDFDETGRYYVWVLGKAVSGKTGTSDSIHVGFNQQITATAERISGFSDQFGWSNKTMDKTNPFIDVDSTGLQTVNLWMREDGFTVDKFLLTKDPAFDPATDLNFALVSDTPISRKEPVASVSYDNPPFSNEVRYQSWGASQGLAPQMWFWENVPQYQEFQRQTNQSSNKIRESGRVPYAGLQLWQDAFRRSQPGETYGKLPGHQAWVKWIEERPEYLGVRPDGTNFGWGYVSPLVPLKPEDYPEDFEGDVAYFADWQAERLGRLAAFTGIQGFSFSDFFDSHPHSGPHRYFNSRIIKDFERLTNITLSSTTLTEQADEIRTQYYQNWLDYWVERWAYNWSAIVREFHKHTGEAPALRTQVSFTPASMRRHGAIDPRVILQKVSPDNIVFNVQTVQSFMMKRDPVPESFESASIGLHAAREPEGYYGHILMSSEDRYWEAVEELWPQLSQETQQELGWKRLKRTWLESGWTHVATRQGNTRRAAESWTRSYHDKGEIDQSWVKLLRDIDPTRPFGPAVYYSVNIERGYESHHGANGNTLRNSYLGGRLEPVTELKEGGIPFNYYVSDAALNKLQDNFVPSAWIIPDRYLDEKDLLPVEERKALEAIAPILSEDNAQKFDYPLSFSSDQEGRTITGFGFYDQNDNLIVVASDRITIGESNANLGATLATVHLKLPDGKYIARELLSDQETAFTVTSGSGEFLTTIDRWDTQVFEIIPEYK